MKQKLKSIFKKKPKAPKKEMTPKEYEQLGRRMEQVYTTGYASRGRLMYMNFLRGIAYGVGIFIGGTIVVGIVITVLVQFEEVPVIGPFAQKINQSIEKGSQADIEELRQENQSQ